MKAVARAGEESPRSDTHAKGLVHELAKFAPGTEESTNAVLERFRRWCAANGEPPLPTTDWTVLRYLHSQYPNLSHDYAASIVQALNRAHRRAEVSPAAQPRLTAYLRLLHGDPAVPKSKPPTPAIRPEDAKRMAQALATDEPSLAARWLAGTLALALSSSKSLAEAARFPRDEIRATPAGVSVGGSPDTVFVAARSQPALVRALRDLTLLDPAFRGPTNPTGALARAFGRAGLPVPSPTAAVALPPEQYEWLLANTEVDLHRRLRDRAYLLVGLVCALRHHSLARIGIEDLRASGHEFTITVRALKNDQSGAGRTVTVPCLSGSEPLCAAVACPACALRAWLRCVTDVQRRREGPLFATRYGGQWRVMSRQNGRLRLVEMWADAGLAPVAVSTRSLRAGGISAAHESGATLEDIAARMSFHRTLSECARYLRRRDDWHWDFVLVV